MNELIELCVAVAKVRGQIKAIVEPMNSSDFDIIMNLEASELELKTKIINKCIVIAQGELLPDPAIHGLLNPETLHTLEMIAKRYLELSGEVLQFDEEYLRSLA